MSIEKLFYFTLITTFFFSNRHMHHTRDSCGGRSFSDFNYNEPYIKHKRYGIVCVSEITAILHTCRVT